ncbi:MAG: amino acid permease [Proteobacteria bacterium]|nr:amino acid permease [Pseudomonadota bacterium]
MATVGSPQEPKLKRSLSLTMLVFYGLGVTVGAGIYVLIGRVAGVAGLYTPASFLVAAVLAGLSAFAFAEMSSRFPRSAGEAVYVHQGFGSQIFATIVGLFVVLSGLVSSAALSNGFVGYLQTMASVPDWIALPIVVLALGALAAWGIAESVIVAAVVTVIEVGALVVLLGLGFDHLAAAPARIADFVPPLEAVPLVAVLSGGVLAFYAFLGFEDMVNVVEEVENAPRTMPAAILLTLVITTVLYLAVAILAVSALPLDTLAATDAPLALLFQSLTGGSSAPIAAIAMAAVINGALIQIIMASRVLYGLADQAWIPSWLGRVHPRTQTPLNATVTVAVLILIFALALPLGVLARITSLVVLAIFAAVNLALLAVKHRDPRPEGVAVYPAILPACGFLASLGIILFEAVRIAGG